MKQNSMLISEANLWLSNIIPGDKMRKDRKKVFKKKKEKDKISIQLFSSNSWTIGKVYKIHYKNHNNRYYDNQKDTDNKRIQSIKESNRLFKKYRFDQAILRFIVEKLKYNLEMHCEMKINGIKYNYKLYRD